MADHEMTDGADAPDEIEALRAFVDAHAKPDPRTGSREAIRYMPFRGGLLHHGLGDERPVVDDALIEELRDHGLISIDYHPNSWSLTPTTRGRRLVEEATRVNAAAALNDAAVAPIAAAVESQGRAANPIAWPAVRPVLNALRAYWQASAYPVHGVTLTPLAKALPDDALPLFAATIRTLVAGGYLESGELGGVLVDDAGRRTQFPGEVTLTEKAHTVLDGWPGAAPSDLAENLLAVLLSAAAEEGDPVRRSRLEALAKAVKDVGVAVTSDVIAKVITGGMP